jgi:hypothetical protein
MWVSGRKSGAGPETSDSGYLRAVPDRTRVVDRLAITGAGPDRALARR